MPYHWLLYINLHDFTEELFHSPQHWVPLKPLFLSIRTNFDVANSSIVFPGTGYYAYIMSSMSLYCKPIAST